MDIGELFLLGVCLLVFLVQIVILVEAIKKKDKKYWIDIFGLEVFAIIIVQFISYYLQFIVPPGDVIGGIQYVRGEMICVGASILYLVMLCVTIILGTVEYMKNRKSINNNPEDEQK